MAEVRRWRIQSGEKEHVVEYVVRLMGEGEGEVVVDGKIVAAWGSRFLALPAEVRFEIEGQPAMLRRKGLLFAHFDLIYEGRVYGEKQGRM